MCQLSTYLKTAPVGHRARCVALAVGLAQLLLLVPVAHAGNGLADELSAPAPAPRKVIIPHLLSSDINHEDYYFSRLLQLAMDKTVDSDGPWVLVPHPDWLRDQRLRLALDRGEVDVLWSQTNPEFEREMLAVRVPLLHHLSGYRLLLIRSADQPRFNRVRNLEDLRQFVGGMGQQWPDLPILEANGLRQVVVPGYGKLFKMLAAGRFDYFSRGIYQVQSEVDFYPDLPLAIERNLLLKYDSDTYFFVARGNQALARRLGKGLELALQDGSFDQLFRSIPRYQWALDELEKNTRIVIELQSSPTAAPLVE